MLVHTFVGAPGTSLSYILGLYDCIYHRVGLGWVYMAVYNIGWVSDGFSTLKNTPFTVFFKSKIDSFKCEKRENLADINFH